MLIGSLGPGGKERQLILLLKELNKNYQNYVILAVMNKTNKDQLLLVEKYVDRLIIKERYSKFDFISPLFYIIKVIKKERIQLIHTWGSGVWDLLGLITSRLCNINFLHNGVQSSPKKLNLQNQLSKWSAHFADKVIANSYSGLSAFGLDSHPRAEVIYNGLDLERFEYYCNNGKQYQLCMVANFREEKDHQTLLLAMPKIISRYPNVQLFLIGHDFGTLSDIKSLIDEKHIQRNIRIITDCLEPAPYIADCQVCLLSTHGEGIANVILEYMALAKPVIVSNNGGSPEVVINEVTGYLVPPKKPEAIADKTLQLLDNPVQAEEMGRRGKAIVTKKFSVDKMSESFENVYEELLQ